MMAMAVVMAMAVAVAMTRKPECVYTVPWAPILFPAPVWYVDPWVHPAPCPCPPLVRTWTHGCTHRWKTAHQARLRIETGTTSACGQITN